MEDCWNCEQLSEELINRTRASYFTLDGRKTQYCGGCGIFLRKDGVVHPDTPAWVTDPALRRKREKEKEEQKAKQMMEQHLRDLERNKLAFMNIKERK